MQAKDYCIVVAEDNAILRYAVTQVLSRSGYTVLSAACGDDAMAKAAVHRGPIHLLLTDLVMPNTGGLELARMLRERYPDMAVLLMTGLESSELPADLPESSE